MAPRTYVLVHGAWHGGWCWARVAPLLVAAGHRVVAPTLTGLGDRAHLFSASVDLATHVRDVLAAIDCDEPPGRLIAVAHSYAGNLMAGVADALRDRIDHYVYLDAVVPPDGVARWSWSDFATPALAQAREQDIATRGAGVALPPPASADAFGIVDPADAAWVMRRLRPMPAGCWRGSIELPNGGARGLRRRYVAATAPAYAPVAPVVARVRQDPEWTVTTIDAGHDMMVTAPAALARVLLDA